MVDACASTELGARLLEIGLSSLQVIVLYGTSTMIGLTLLAVAAYRFLRPLDHTKPRWRIEDVAMLVMGTALVSATATGVVRLTVLYLHAQ